MSLRLRSAHQPTLEVAPGARRNPRSCWRLQWGELSSSAAAVGQRPCLSRSGLAAAEGESAALHLEAEEGHTASEDDEGGPEHAVDDVRDAVELLDNRLRLRVRIVVAEEVGRLTRAPSVHVGLDCTLVLVSSAMTDAVRTLRNNTQTHTHVCYAGQTKVRLDKWQDKILAHYIDMHA